MLDNGPKRRNRATVPNSIFLKLAGNSLCWHSYVSVFSPSGLARPFVGLIEELRPDIDAVPMVGRQAVQYQKLPLRQRIVDGHSNSAAILQLRNLIVT